MFLVASLLFSLLALKASGAKAPAQPNEDYYSNDLVVHDNAITTSGNHSVLGQGKTQANPRSIQPIRRHSTRSETQINPELLANFLSRAGSPLAEHANQIAASPYAGTIIGICWIEQYHCTKAPGFNFWGIGPGKTYPDLPTAINAISSLLTKYEANGHSSVESLNCYYVQPCSQNWLQTVLKIKGQLEAL